MLDFIDKKLAPWSFLTLIGILGLVLNLSYLLYKPKDNTKITELKRKNQLRSMDLTALSARKDTKKASAEIKDHLWTVSEEQIGPMILGKVNELADAHKLKVLSFRPQKVQSVQGLRQLPYQISVEGPFLDVLALCRDIDSGGAKLVVNSIQFASADGNTDKLSSTIGVLAYIPSAGETTPNG